MDLNLIVHGRCASSLVTAMLVETGEFNLWGVPEYPAKKESGWIRDLIRECLYMGKWKSEPIKDTLNRFNTNGKVLIKMPEFGFCIDKFFFLEPSVLVIRRSPFEILRSIASLKWEESVVQPYEKYRIMELAEKHYKLKGGDTAGMSTRHKVFLVLCFARWYTDLHVSRYRGRKLFIYFDDLMFRKEDVYCQLDRFYGLEPRKYWDLWNELSNKKQMGAARQPDADFKKSYNIDFSKDWEVFSEIHYTFNK